MKRPKGKELNDLQKIENKKIPSKGVIIEHPIDSVKVLRIVKDEI